MRTSPGVCGVKGSDLPLSVLWSRISFMRCLSSANVKEQVDDCSRGARGWANRIAMGMCFVTAIDADAPHG